MPVEPTDGGTSAAEAAYTLVGAVTTSRVAGDNTVQQVIQATARSKKFGVTFTWFVNPTVWTADGGPPLIRLKTAQVNAIMEAPHVQAFRTEQDQDASRLLVNIAVITVGTDDDAITEEVRVRMDRINEPRTFAAIASAWKRLVALSDGALS